MRNAAMKKEYKKEMVAFGNKVPFKHWLKEKGYIKEFLANKKRAAIRATRKTVHTSRPAPVPIERPAKKGKKQ